VREEYHDTAPSAPGDSSYCLYRAPRLLVNQRTAISSSAAQNIPRPPQSQLPHASRPEYNPSLSDMRDLMVVQAPGAPQRWRSNPLSGRRAAWDPRTWASWARLRNLQRYQFIPSRKRQDKHLQNKSPPIPSVDQTTSFWANKDSLPFATLTYRKSAIPPTRPPSAGMLPIKLISTRLAGPLVLATEGVTSASRIAPVDTAGVGRDSRTNLLNYAWNQLLGI